MSKLKTIELSKYTFDFYKGRPPYPIYGNGLVNAMVTMGDVNIKINTELFLNDFVYSYSDGDIKYFG